MHIVRKGRKIRVYQSISVKKKDRESSLSLCSFAVIAKSSCLYGSDLYGSGLYSSDLCGLPVFEISSRPFPVQPLWSERRNVRLLFLLPFFPRIRVTLAPVSSICSFRAFALLTETPE